MDFKNKRVVDFQAKDCSGCALCVDICPKDCITMQPDGLGYLRPVIDDAVCIDCGLCAKKCVIVNPETTIIPQDTFAAVRTDSEKIKLSSSGGVFAAIAECLIEKGWMVAGCILDENLNPRHILTDEVSKVRLMYGSKYVQSYTDGIYAQVATALKEGYNVLFSGTPCQVAAVKRFTKNHENLLTVEVICHGVPNVEMFHSALEAYDKAAIKHFVFRDKGQGWTFNNLITYKNGKAKKVNHRLSSYMTYFLEGETYRDSCYVCPYAKQERGADITLGDFWGVVGRREDLKEKINIEKGVSCLIVNTPKGMSVIQSSSIETFEVDYEDIKDGNEPLNHPSRHTDKRKVVISLWKQSKSWTDVHTYWKAHDYKVAYSIWSLIPMTLQHRIRLLLGKR